MHVTSGRSFDERRNSSAVIPPPPWALPEALRALARFRRDEPELVRWIEDGHPLLTHAEHELRFGGPYKRLKRTR